jgi:hypothetical protein
MLEEAYRNVEGPKFYLEFQDLTRRLAIIFEDIFERYCAYKLYEEKGGQLATEADLLELAKGGSGSKVATAKRTETSEMLLANMSTFAFTEFLWNSEKGINATLSTRIRHGSLENQLKRVFGAYGMLATRDLDGVYQCDRSVLDVLNAVNAGSRATICTAFIDFTHSINALYDGLVAEKLRIRVPDEVIPQLEDQGVPRKECGNEKSIIDFRGLFHDSAISRLKDVQLTTATALVSELHKIFIKNTHDAFSLLRTHMNTNVAVEVNTALQKLDDAIVSILGDGTERALLRQKVLSAKDGFVHDLSIIQKWFSEAAKIDSGIDTIKKLIATATRVIGFASNGKLGKLIEGDVVDMPIKPEAGVLLYEVVSILMRNIVQHSGLEAGQEVEYNFQISEAKKSVLTFCNKMTSHEVCDFAVASAKAHLDQPKDPRVLDRSPGGTGLARIRALLGQISHEHVSIQVSKLMDQPKFLVRVEF